MLPRRQARSLSALSFVLVSFAAACGGPPKQAADPSVAPGEPAGTSKPPPPAPGKQDPTAELAEAEAALGANDAARARKAAEAALAKDPKSAKGHFFAALAIEALGDKPAAEKHYRAALATAPGFAEAAGNLSAMLLDDKRAADAVAVMKPLADKLGDDPLVQANYAAALAATGDHAGAAAAYEKAIKKEPRPDLRLGLADALLKADKKEDAAKALRDGLASLPENRDLLGAFARRLGQARAYDDAIKTIDRAIKIKSGADLLTYRALFKRGAKDTAGAKTDLEAAAKEDPKFAPAHLYLGEVLEDLKKPAEAKKEYERAIELGGETGTAKEAKAKLEALKSKK